MGLPAYVTVCGRRVERSPSPRKGYSLLIGTDATILVERYRAWWRAEFILVTPRNWTDTLSVKSYGHKSAPAAARGLTKLIKRWRLESFIAAPRKGKK